MSIALSCNRVKMCTSVANTVLKFALHLSFALLTFPLLAQTGPGGVGSNDGTSSLSIWFRPDNGLSTTGALVDSWLNSAGTTALNVSESGTNRPTLVTGAANGYSEISFNGSNKLTTAVGAMTTTNFVTNQASTFIVNRADNTTQTSCVYTTDPLEVNRFSNHIPWSATVYFDIGDCCADRIQVGSLTGLNNYSVWSYDAINTGTGKQLYRNGTQVQSVAVSTLTYNSHASHRFNLGGFTSGSNGFVGDITEVIIFRTKINTAQRRIIQNYLSAKYGIALAADDLYTQDNSVYDHEVAGIGRVDASNIHNDSRGTGIVRVSGPTGLGDNEYFFWGHDNGALVPQTSDLPAGIQGRLTRVWSGQEVGNIDDVDIDFDLTGLGPVTASDLRLLVDTDATFASGATVVSGATAQGGNVYRFSDVSGLVGGTGTSNTVTRFTLGSINITQTPLPITLLSFDAAVANKNVRLTWKTAQEINNEYFTIERSANGTGWEEVLTLPGSGNSHITKTYTATDEHPLWGISYYRLKQTDYDGKSTYSNVVFVTVERSFQDIEVYPVPSRDEVFIRYPPTESITIKLTDQIGREHIVFPVEGQQSATLDISTLSPGVYFLHLTNGTVSIQRKIVKE